jgi:hypothetical protein
MQIVQREPADGAVCQISSLTLELFSHTKNSAPAMRVTQWHLRDGRIGVGFAAPLEPV